MKLNASKVAHISTGRLRQEDHNIEVSLSYITNIKRKGKKGPNVSLSGKVLAKHVQDPGSISRTKCQTAH